MLTTHGQQWLGYDHQFERITTVCHSFQAQGSASWSPPSLKVPQDSSAGGIISEILDRSLSYIPPLQLRQGWWRRSRTTSSPVPVLSGETQQLLGTGHHGNSLLSYQ